MFPTTLLTISLLVGMLSMETRADEMKLTMNTHVYKTVDGIDIHADVYRTDSAAKKPVLVWIHGGALINGSRNNAPKRMQALCENEDFVLVSIDYRLAPDVKVPSIIEDVQDAFRWIRAKGPALFDADPSRIVVAGGSAGGYLTMMTGICIEPRPIALLAYYGYGDIDGAWYRYPSTHYRKTRPLYELEEVLPAVSGKVQTGVGFSRDLARARGRYYLYLRQNGLWTREISGFDPNTERDKLDPYCPVRNITADYPPILMIHGNRDTDVPYHLSVDMARELARHNVAHELITIENGEHGFGGGDPEAIADAHARGMAFIKRHLRGE
jgi:acetyl esterase/lipase